MGGLAAWDCCGGDAAADGPGGKGARGVKESAGVVNGGCRGDDGVSATWGGAEAANVAGRAGAAGRDAAWGSFFSWDGDRRSLVRDAWSWDADMRGRAAEVAVVGVNDDDAAAGAAGGRVGRGSGISWVPRTVVGPILVCGSEDERAGAAGGRQRDESSSRGSCGAGVLADKEGVGVLSRSRGASPSRSLS
jgi:hypothetical protein